MRKNAPWAELVAEDIFADQVVYGNICTEDAKHPKAEAAAIVDGRFAYVGSAEGVQDFIGKDTEVLHFEGKFIMPGIIDSHVHVTTGVGFEYADLGLRFECNGKQEALDFMAKYIKEYPGQKRYRFYLERKYLNGEELNRDDLDAICPDAELVIVEGEVHSNWVNSKVLELHGIEAGKDADYLVFDNDLLTAEHEGFSYNMPRDVFFCGKKVNCPSAAGNRPRTRQRHGAANATAFHQ